MRIRLALAALALWAAARPASATLTPNAQQALDAGLHDLYDLDYARSRTDFRSLIEKEPDNPFGYLFESGGIWWEASQEYGLFKDTPTLQGLFEEDVDEAIRKGEVWADSDDKSQRADGHFVLGMAYGTKGQWSLMKGHWLEAWSDGKKAIKHLRKCEKLDSSYYDAELGLGVFDYEAAQLSGIAKIGAIIGGMQGNEARGLARLRLAAEKGRYGSRQAEVFLATIFFMDKKRYDQALPLLDRLREQFPDSLYFQFLAAAAESKTGNVDLSLDTAWRAFQEIQADPPGFERKLLSLVCGPVGPACLDAGMAGELGDWLDEALSADERLAAQERPARRRRGPRGRRALDPEQKTRQERLSLLHLYRGYAHDLLGNRDEAVSQYQWVLGHSDFADDHAQARDCLSRPCGAPVLLERLRALSEGRPPAAAADVAR